MNINLKLKKSEFSPHFFPLLDDYSHRWEIYKGGAGSGKSYFIAQKMIYRACNEQIKMLVCRRYGTTIRDTVFSTFKDVLRRWKLTEYVDIIESTFRIRFPNGSEIIFKGLDEETKILSLNDISTIFVEEVFEVPKDIIDQLNLRMRSKKKGQQILIAFNPISKNHWLYDFCNNPPDNSLVDHSTFKDNPFLPDSYISTLEELRERNPGKAKIYYYGEFGANPDGLVFSNWEVRDFAVSALEGEIRAGIDFGYIDTTFFVKAVYRAKEREIWVYEEWAKDKAQLDEIAAALDPRLNKHTTLYCDSAEPRSIDYLRQQGFYAKPCIKGPDSVRARILFLQNNKIIISPNCKRLIEEFENFSYEKDKAGNWTENTTHEWSHGIDALGYALSDVYTKNKLKTLDKRILGL